MAAAGTDGGSARIAADNAAATSFEEKPSTSEVKTLRGLLQERPRGDAGGKGTSGECWIDELVQFECVQRAALTKERTEAAVCYPVQRYFKRCHGKTAIEITPLVVTPRDR